MTQIEQGPFAFRCRKAAAAVWQASHEHPFLKALLDGSLDSDRFRFYQMQDARYLEAFADACSLISVRFSDPDSKLWFIDAARLSIVVERQLHEEYGRELGYTAADIRGLERTPNNLAYGNHMVALAQTGSLVEALAALTPCPWLYTDIGMQMETIDPDHRWANWLRTYADPGFVTYTAELLQHLERAAEHAGEDERSRAERAFVTSVRYEWMFWEQAWRTQEWPV